MLPIGDIGQGYVVLVRFQLQRAEVAPMRPREKRIARRTGPGRRTTRRVNAPAGATQPEPPVIAQYRLKRTRISALPALRTWSVIQLAPSPDSRTAPSTIGAGP